MPNLPAFCDSCDTIFPSGFFFDHASNVTLSGNKAGPCPKCKAMGSIPDGVFNFVGGVIEVLSAPQITIDRLRRLASLIEELKKDPTAKALQKLQDAAPELKETLKNTPIDSGHITAWLSLILMAIQTIILGATLYADSGPTEKEIQDMIDTTIEKGFKGNTTETPESEATIENLRRNDTCSCGSGRRYKHCCGVLI